MMRTLLATSFLAMALFSSCQTYDFERVEPLAIAQTTQSSDIGIRKLKPNLMLLLDKSGSMATPIQPPAATCPSGCGPQSPCPANCPTRISELKSSMTTFLNNAGSLARMGLGLFPTNNQCGVPDSLTVELPAAADADDDASNAANVANATLINQQIQDKGIPLGGTPTNLSLRFVATTAGLNQNDFRDDFVLLLTDGVPNCNDQNVNNCCADDTKCAAPNPCACTTSSCNASLCALGCNDRQGVVEAAQDLRTQNIKTIVIGFGIGDTLSTDQVGAPDVLNAIAEAGGFPRTCANDAACGPGDHCTITAGSDKGVCNQKYYRATNGAELQQALADIANGIGNLDPCIFKLETQPEDAKYLAVIVDGVNQLTGADTWAFKDAEVQFQGAMCTRLKAATQNAPIKVEIRIVKVI